MPVRFIHSLPAVRSFQDRRELSELTNWWRDTTGGVCTLVGIGGSGKTTLIDHFLRLFPGLLASSPAIEEVPLSSPDSLLVYSFDSDPNPESMLRGLADILEIVQTNQTDLSYNEVLGGLREKLAAAPGSRHLLVFDALENLQEQRSDDGSFGLVRDDRVRDLLERCALGQFPGVYILVSTRIRVANLEETQPPLYLPIDLGDLTTSQAISLLRLKGVEGPDALLRSLINQVGSHALTIDLIAGYLINFGDLNVDQFLNSTSEELRGLIGAEVSGRKRGVLRQAQQRSQIFERYRKTLESENPSALAVLERASILDVAFDRSVLEEVFVRTDGPDSRVSEADLELTSAQVSAALSLFSELGLVQHSPDGALSIHAVVREAVLKWLSPSLRAAGHNLFRNYLAYRLDEVPQAEWGHTHESLQLMEAYVIHTIEAGSAQDAWRFYWQSMGGFVNFGLNRAEFARGSRICSYFVGKSPPQIAGSASSLASYERDFWIEWGRYLKELGQLESAKHCMLRAEVLPAGPMYGADSDILATERAEILILRGRLQQALSDIQRYLEGRERIGSDDSAEQESIDLQVYLAQTYALLGDVDKALPVFEKLRSGWDSPIEGLLDNGRLYEAQLLSRLNKLDVAEINEVSDVVYAPIGTWAITLVPHWDLFWAREHAERGDLLEAENFLNRGKEYARANDKKVLLCQAAIVQAQWTLNSIRRQINDQRSYDTGPLADVIDELTEALETARSSGFGLHVIDILNARARCARYLVWSFDALRDAQVAVNEGFEEDKRLGLPEILPAAAPACGYRWAEAEGREIIAEAFILNVNQFLGSSRITNTSSPEVSPELSQARDELIKAQELRQQVGDPLLETTNYLLEALEAGRLNYYPSTPIVFTSESDATTEVADQQPWDVFVSYNSKDRRAAKWITNELRGRRLAVWLDEREMRAGTSWQSALDEILRSVPTALVLVGSHGLGPWQKSEVEMLLIEQKRRSVSVIPVRLPGAPRSEDLPLFLPILNSVDFTSVDSISPSPKVIESLLAVLPS